MLKTLSIGDRCLIIIGYSVKKRIGYLKKWCNKSIPKGAIESSSFIKDVHEMTNTSPKFESKIEVDLLKHSIVK